jgi:hypothetical protein
MMIQHVVGVFYGRTSHAVLASDRDWFVMMLTCFARPANSFPV